MSVLFTIILATFLITLAVWVAIFFLFLKKELLNKITLFLVALSAGAMMGGAFLHLLPEASEYVESEILFAIPLLSFILFFILEKVFHWRHCHNGNCKVHSFGYINLLGDSIHNFIDGLVIAGAFLVDIRLGVVTTIAIALHEIPQEIGDFGVLIYAGFKKKVALVLNYIVAFTVVFGGVAGYFLSTFFANIVPYLLSFAAGGFIYIAASDLVPEIKREEKLIKSIVSLFVFLFGILLMYILKII